MPRNLLLLTATITPRADTPSLARTDPDARRRDYLRALPFYLDLLGRGLDGLVFVENSASDLSDFQALAEHAGHPSRTEFISFAGLDYAASRGRAYGEFKLLDYAGDHSRTLEGFGQDDRLWKMTGRYLVRNLPELLQSAPANCDFYCNLRNYPRRWADMYLFAASRAGFDGLVRGAAERFREEEGYRLPEEEFWVMVKDAPAELRIEPRFREVPIIDAVRGCDNRNYVEGEGRGKLLARRVALRVAPWLWI